MKESALGCYFKSPDDCAAWGLDTVELDPVLIGRDAGRIADEIMANLTSLMGAKAIITLEINVETPTGIP